MSINRIVFLMIILFMQSIFAQQNLAILPVPNPKMEDKNKVNLGKMLYKENVFDKNNQRSCNSCHILNSAGIDNLPKYITLNGKIGLLNTPTVLNSSLNFRQFWDGRAKSLKDVIEDHLQNSTVFANNWPTVIKNVKENNKLVEAYKHVYGTTISQDNIKEALVLYLNTLLTPQSMFDRFLLGDKSALSPLTTEGLLKSEGNAKKGYELFKSYGCITCHEGPGIGGNLYQKFGIYKDYFAGRIITKADLGLYNITGKDEDKYVFKVPSLRNVALTAPYLHDGSASSLDEVIKLMGIYQVGQPIPSYDILDIKAFLQSLTGTRSENE